MTPKTARHVLTEFEVDAAGFLALPPIHQRAVIEEVLNRTPTLGLLESFRLAAANIIRK